MAVSIKYYLDIVKRNLNLEPSLKEEVIHELETHFEDRLNELRDAGLSDEEAISTCVRFLGTARALARRINEAHEV